MKKLFLTSFKFKTGLYNYKEQRLTVVSTNDINRYDPDGLHTGKFDQLELIAQEKCKQWFSIEFPESEILSIIAHKAIDEFEILPKEEKGLFETLGKALNPNDILGNWKP